MKDTTLALILIFFCQLVMAQDCPIASIYPTTQADIDSFIILYPNCDRIKGDLWITGGENGLITNLDAFQNIKWIEGDLIIRKTLNLKDVNGLSNLKEIEGILLIYENSSLINLDGIQQVEKIEELNIRLNHSLLSIPEFNDQNLNSVIIGYNRNLTSINGFSTQDTLINLFIDGNENLENISGFENIVYISNQFSISSNDVLTSVHGFKNLVRVGNFIMGGSPILKTLDAGQLLVEVDRNFGFGPGLVNPIPGFRNLKRVGDNLSISGSSSIKDLKWLSNLENIGGGINISNNENLRSIDVFTVIDSVLGSVYITNNTKLNNIDSLNNLNFIEGNFVMEENPSLFNIPAFTNLTTIRGSFILENNSIDKIKGFNSLGLVGGFFSISKDSVLAEITGFDSLRNIGQYLDFRTLSNLKSIRGFYNLKNLGSDLNFRSMLLLEEIDGFYNLNEILEDFSMFFLPSLRKVKGFYSMRKIHKDLIISYCAFLGNLNFLNSLEEVYDARISHNDTLSSILGLSNLISKKIYYLSFTYNRNLNNCDIFPVCDRLFDGRLLDFAFNGENCREDWIANRCLGNKNILGNVFLDENANGNMDPFENNLQLGSVLLDEESIIYIRPDGSFRIMATDSVVEKIEYLVPNDWVQTTDSALYNLVAYDESSTQEEISFGVYPSVITSSIEAYINQPQIVCDRNSNFRITIKNTGTQKHSGYFDFFYEGEIVEFSHQFVQIDEGHIQVRFGTILPMQTQEFTAAILNPGADALGEDLAYKVNAYFLDFESLEVVVQDEHLYISTLLCSFDPNDKAVNPRGIGENNLTLFSDPLNYTIRFQNTGNFPATHVLIKDTLDQNLDLSSFRFNSSSHPITEIRRNGNVISFDFRSIYLPDSTNNEPESHGFVSYFIKHKDESAEETIIENNASIFFDSNEPIITNTVKNTLVSKIDINTNVIQTPESKFEIILTPNPTNGMVQLNFNNTSGIEYFLEIIDVHGRPISKSYSENKTMNSHLIDLTSLPSSIYYISIYFENGQIVTQKLLKN